MSYELKKLCSDAANSVQMSNDPAVLSNFPWAQIIDEGMTCTRNSF